MNLEIEIPDDLKNEISALRTELAEIKKNLQPKEPPKYYTKAELAKMFRVTIGTINNWQEKGVLKPNQLGGRIYFRAEDVEAALVELEK